MLTIRLQRRGRKNDPSFRVIITDSKRKPKTGNYLEMLGSYDPRTDRVDLKAERITHWIENGAKTSDTVHNLLVSNKIIDAKKINVLPAFKAKPEEKTEEKPVEAPAEGDAPVEASAEGDNAVVEEAPAA